MKREYGHNLKKAYDNLQRQEQVLNPAEYRVLAKASTIYDLPNKGFEYVSVRNAVTGLSDFPDLQVLRLIASKLL